MERIRVAHVGLGPIGCRMVELVNSRASLEIVGAADIDPKKAGRDLGTVAGLSGEVGVAVSDGINALFAHAKPDIVVHTTGSKLEAVIDQLEAIMSGGANIVSTCEELSYPYRRHPELSRRIDVTAKQHGVTVLGTGINPGFLMDTWPLTMTGVCREVTAISVSRVQDATSRRIPFQQKIGAGLSIDEFRARVASGDFGHVGLKESIYMIADTLGLPVEDIQETIEPVVLDRQVASDYVTVEPGQAAGLRQQAFAEADGRTVISMDFQAYLGADDPHDEVRIDGVPPLTVRIAGGTQGDIGTVAITVNAIPRVVSAPPGLLTMRDIPVVTCR